MTNLMEKKLSSKNLGFLLEKGQETVKITVTAYAIYQYIHLKIWDFVLQLKDIPNHKL